MKPILPLLTVLTLVPTLVRADDRADAVLKETRLRMSRAATFSFNVRYETPQKQPLMRFFVQRPDKFRLEMVELGRTLVMILAGSEALVINKGVKFPVPPGRIQSMVTSMLYLITVDFEKAVNVPFRTTYVTQKMIDEKTVVDVIDVKGETEEGKMRLYIDNNSLLRKVIIFDSDQNTTISFTDLVVDEPIPASKFATK